MIKELSIGESNGTKVQIHLKILTQIQTHNKQLLAARLYQIMGCTSSFAGDAAKVCYDGVSYYTYHITKNRCAISLL